MANAIRPSSMRIIAAMLRSPTLDNVHCAPEQVAIVSGMQAMLSLTIRPTPLLEQLVLTDFMPEGHFGGHVRRK